MIAITVYGVPAPQGSTRAFMRRGMRHPIVTADCARTKPWRQAIVDAARQELRGRVPADGPVSLGVTFYLPRPKSAPRRVVEPSTRPDLDKLLRALCDALTAAGVWRDDAQLVHVVARKAFAGGVHDDEGEAGVPRAVIYIRERNACEIAEARVRTLEEALREWDTLSLVIESAVRAEVCRDARAVEHYNRLVRLIHSARAALRGGE